MHVWQVFANPLTLLASLEGSYAPSIEHTRRLKLPIEAAVCRVEEPQQQMPQYLLIIIQQQRKLECCLHNSSTFHHHHPTSTILTYYYMSKVSWLKLHQSKIKDCTETSIISRYLLQTKDTIYKIRNHACMMIV